MFYRSHIRDCVTLDFETDAICNRPNFPPEPVGLAIRYPDAQSEYMAWGHPTGNNCTKGEVVDWLKDLWRDTVPILFFNAKFDLAVAEEKLGLSRLPWGRVHDAMFLAFLADPHSRSLGLKPLCEDLLNWAPDEKDAIFDYVWKYRRGLMAEYGGKITRAKTGPHSAAAWISKCPAHLVEPYAIGDVDRTHGLFDHLYPIIAENGMCEAYDRERRILPIFMDNERDGMRVDLDALADDVPELQRSLATADDTLRRLLGSPDLNIDADAQLAEALSSARVIADKDWVLTKTGQKSVAKDNLTFDMFKDVEVGHVLFYRNRLTTALSTFMVPWLEQASQRNGIISTHWNQVRGGAGGTRTGRPSTNDPNFLNIPKLFKQEFDMKYGNKWGLAALPFVRWYVQPDPDEAFMHRDFNAQEMRIFAHYENGDLMHKFQDDPDLKPHDWIRDEIYALTGIKLDTTPVKIMNFQSLYGGGVPAVAKALGVSLAKAKEYKAFHDRALPGRKLMNDAIMQMANLDIPICTWGGRLYFPETPRVVDGRMQSFEYKLINYLCQGSAADITKEAIIRWHDHPKKEARFLVTVYDEINGSTPKGAVTEQQAIMAEVMESIELDVVMRSSGKFGPRWGDLKECG